LKSRISQAFFAFTVFVCQALVSAHAFTLGDLRGAVVIGRTLDVSVLVQTGEGEEANAACMRAEVFYADVPQATPRVTVAPGREGSAQWVVRIESAVNVDEPVVTVLLRATCSSSTQRRYVLLADFPVVPDAPFVASVPLAPKVPTLQAPAGVPSAAVSDVPGASASVSATTSPTKPASVKAKPRKNVASAAQGKPAPAKASAPAKGVAPAKRPAATGPRAPGQSVLKLDPLDVLSDKVGASDSSMDFSPAEDALRYSRQIAAFESELKALRVQSANNEKLILDLRAKLQQAEQSQMPAGLLYALVAALLASLLFSLWLWRTRQTDKQVATPEATAAWWNPPGHAPDTVMGTEPQVTQPFELAPVSAALAPVPVVLPGGAKAAPLGPQKVPTALSMPDTSGLDVNLDLGFSAPMPLDQGVDNTTANVPFGTNSIRHISLDAILDVRQQAEFFVSLGQTDQALVILKKQIAETTEANPLLYLDLISLYHSLGMKADFREQRDSFHRLFNGVVPDFPAYNLPGRDLESYPEVVSVLMRLWPRMDALAFLSACIFHDEHRVSRQTYDLSAFRDLLMLHALADVVVDHSSPAYQNTLPLEFDADGVAHFIEETNLPIVTRSLDLDFSAIDTPPEGVVAPDIDLSQSHSVPGKKPQ
jgi:hypothetical protein